MKIQPRLIAIYSVPIVILFIPVFIFFVRAPVLVVSDMAFFELYGEGRIKWESARAALSLYRPVRTVSIADDAGDDLVQFAVAEVSSRPHCVLFPYRFSRAAHYYRETFPGIPVVILQGRNEATSRNIAESDFFVYKTDIASDFYRAGQMALALDNDKKGRIVVFVEQKLENSVREFFPKAFETLEEPNRIIYHTAFSQFSEHPDLSCVVILGVGTEFLEKNEEIPVIFFTWLNPILLPFEVAVSINDAPWTQIVPSVRMLNAGMTEGEILSKIKIFNKNIDRKTLHKLQKIR